MAEPGIHRGERLLQGHHFCIWLHIWVRMVLMFTFRRCRGF
jgi:hypothetical protein